MTDVTLTSFLTGVHTRQDVFNFVYKKLTEQGRGSVDLEADNGDGMCLYRGPDGTKCAVGWMIPDTEYKPKMDVYNNGVVSLLDKFYSEYNVNVLEMDKDFLHSLQSQHDAAAYQVPDPNDRDEFLHEFKENMRCLAESYHLDYSVLDK